MQRANVDRDLEVLVLDALQQGPAHGYALLEALRVRRAGWPPAVRASTRRDRVGHVCHRVPQIICLLDRLQPAAVRPGWRLGNFVHFAGPDGVTRC